MSQVVVKQVDGITFVGKGNSDHWVAMDGPVTFGGSDAGTRPMELFLVSLGGCTGADVASLLKKMRVKYDKIEILVDTERAEDHPKVYTKIDLTYKIYGTNLDEFKDKIEKSINLSQERYCSISAMIKAADIPLNHSYELVKPE